MEKLAEGSKHHTGHLCYGRLLSHWPSEGRNDCQQGAQWHQPACQLEGCCAAHGLDSQEGAARSDLQSGGATALIRLLQRSMQRTKNKSRHQHKLQGSRLTIVRKRGAIRRCTAAEPNMLTVTMSAAHQRDLQAQQNAPLSSRRHSACWGPGFSQVSYACSMCTSTAGASIDADHAPQTSNVSAPVHSARHHPQGSFCSCWASVAPMGPITAVQVTIEQTAGLTLYTATQPPVVGMRSSRAEMPTPVMLPESSGAGPLPPPMPNIVGGPEEKLP